MGALVSVSEGEEAELKPNKTTAKNEASYNILSLQASLYKTESLSIFGSRGRLEKLLFLLKVFLTAIYFSDRDKRVDYAVFLHY